MLLGAAIVAILVTMVLALIRAFEGPSAYDRMLAANLFGSNTVLAIVLVAFIAANPQYLDIALVYALINFTATIALLKYVKDGRFSAPEDS